MRLITKNIGIKFNNNSNHIKCDNKTEDLILIIRKKWLITQFFGSILGIWSTIRKILCLKNLTMDLWKI